MSALTSPSFSKERFLNIMLKRIDTSSNDHKNSIFNTKTKVSQSAWVNAF